MLLALASCSDVAASYLTATNGKAVSQLLEWASWGLCYLECGTMVLERVRCVLLAREPQVVSEFSGRT